MKSTKFIIALLMLFMVSCGQNGGHDNRHHVGNVNDAKTVTVTEYKVVGGDNRHYDKRHYVEKFTIEGHEYLVFSSGLANPPMVVHSESCPCHEMPIGVHLK